MVALVDCGVFVEKQDDDGRSPLALAAAAGLPDIVSILAYDLGAGFERPDKHGLTPLALAAAAGMAECVDVLLELDADARAKDKTGA